MKRLCVILITLAFIPWLSSSATIINIPDVYPTIQQGIDASTDGDTVLVQPGTYVENIDFNGHNIAVGSMFLTTGDTTYISETIIDGDSSESVVTFESAEDSTAVIIGFTIRNGFVARHGGGIYCTNSGPTIINNIIRDNEARTVWGGSGGGGIYAGHHSHPLISKNTIMGNQVTASGFPSYSAGGGIFCDSSSARIIQNTIIENFADAEEDYGGGIACFYSNLVVENNVIVGNDASEGAGICVVASVLTIRSNTIVGNSGFHGGGLYCTMIDSLTVNNTILWGNTGFYGPEIFYVDAEPVVTYCNIQGGWEGEGNIDIDPLFRDPDNGDFHLTSTECGDSYDSPCIDAGSPAILDSLLDCSWGLGTERSDMGGYGGGDSTTVGIDGQDRQVPNRFTLAQNYPNPFNATTVIRYVLPEAADARIEIYDILGRKVETLTDGEKPAGNHTIIWNADDYPSGVYFARLEAGQRSENVKIVLLK